jgi:hypothetical protein
MRSHYLVDFPYSTKVSVPSAIVLLALLIFAAPPARAGFIGPYDPSNFVLINTNADGSLAVLDSNTIQLTGGNNGSDQPGTTDFLILAPATGVVSFDWSYSSLDTPTFDYAGYVINAIFTQLADTDGEAGQAAFQVSTGDMFGFRAGTVDNTGEPGILTVTNFDAPGAASPVPEPGALSLILLAAAAALVCRKSF